MDKLFEEVMLSNAVDDESRFRRLIDEAITTDTVSNFPRYVNEPTKSRTRRLQRAQKEAAEAKEHLEQTQAKANKKKGDPSDTGSLAAIIQQRQQERGKTFLDDLEAKYAAPKKSKAKTDIERRPSKRTRR